MRKLKAFILKVLSALMLLPVVALADDTCWNSSLPMGNNKALCSRSASTAMDLPLITMNASGDLVLNIPVTGRSIIMQNATTQFGAFTSAGGLTLTTGDVTLTAGNINLAAGKNINSTLQIATPAATPAAANKCDPGMCAVATAAANVAVFVGAATPVAGTHFYIRNNNGTNLIRAKAAGGATINGAVAGGYIGLAAGTSMHCAHYVVGDLTCDTYSTAGGTTAALPTPAGP